jgi:hypothetical protein
VLSSRVLPPAGVARSSDAPPLPPPGRRAATYVKAAAYRLAGSLSERVLRKLPGSSMVTLATAIGKCHFTALECCSDQTSRPVRRGALTGRDVTQVASVR